jgi:hypothetical protein
VQFVDNLWTDPRVGNGRRPRLLKMGGGCQEAQDQQQRGRMDAEALELDRKNTTPTRPGLLYSVWNRAQSRSLVCGKRIIASSLALAQSLVINGSCSKQRCGHVSGAGLSPFVT